MYVEHADITALRSASKCTGGSAALSTKSGQPSGQSYRSSRTSMPSSFAALEKLGGGEGGGQGGDDGGGGDGDGGHGGGDGGGGGGGGGGSGGGGGRRLSPC